MLNTGHYLAVTKPLRWLLPLISGGVIGAAVLLAWLLGQWWPWWLGMAIAMAIIAMIPTRDDHVARTLRRRPDLRVLDRLSAEADLQRSVFEVAGELVGCLRVEDCPQHFGNALRSYWSFSLGECWLWERGSWHRLVSMDRQRGAIPQEVGGEPPAITAPVRLPDQDHQHLILDLSPGVSGQAQLICYHALPQPTLHGHRHHDIVALAEILRAQLALALRRVVLFRDLHQLARTDPLTGCDRRWYGEQRLDELLREHDTSLILLDIDLFKQINDRYGHMVGDQVLTRVGRDLQQQLRAHDVVYRYGGEEFVILLSGIDHATAPSILERILSTIQTSKGPGPAVTCSAGLTRGLRGENPRSVLARADRACYDAKRRGRNQWQQQ